MNTKKDFMSEQISNLNEKIKRCNDKAKTLELLHAETQNPQPLNLDEVSAAFIASLRVNNWEDLGEMFGGYKIGRIYSYILNALNERIEESTAATIRVDVPLYEQCPIINMTCDKNIDWEKEFSFSSEGYKCGGKCKNSDKEPEKDEEKYCLYCKEKDGTINNDVFVRINDVELGSGWVCKECFLESCKEKDELFKEQEQKLDKATSSLLEIKKTIYNFGLSPAPQNVQNEVSEVLQSILKSVAQGLKEEEI